MQKAKLLITIIFIFALTSCLGVGSKVVSQGDFRSPLPYDKAFELSLKAAEEMVEECKKVNPFNFPVLVSLGTSKSRGVITMHYRYDPEAGSVYTRPPMDATSVAKRVFVPHFAAEFYMHIRFQREGDTARGLQIEVTQMKGVKKEIFDEEMQKLRTVYLEFLKRYWK